MFEGMSEERVDPDDARLDVAAFDAVSAPAALELVRPLCASPAWMDAMVARRPHGTIDRVLATSDAVVATLSAPQLSLAAANDAQVADARSAVVARVGDDRAAQQLALRDELAAIVRTRLQRTLA
ncbi:hypothetical protein SAMN05443575_1573 [Jatrophihabitans endophyticus]|uniref:Uncharacterized protein n=2 Tax=Jatrophihabitans endophyticus TaxID=1206085 RepID=A0A1M5HMP8_9ACTN|nr:hypothetical protein SAMN05443575_1573 [Jatrophihabitans endophyticus]